MLPQIFLTGNVVADPELRFTAGGKAVAKFRVAANSRVKGPDGSWRDGETCFLDAIVWEAKAEALVEAVTKGTAVMLSGRLQQRSYETAQGERRSVYEVVAEEVAVIVKPGKPAGVAADPWGAEQGSWGAADAAPPF